EGSPRASSGRPAAGGADGRDAGGRGGERPASPGVPPVAYAATAHVGGRTSRRGGASAGGEPHGVALLEARGREEDCEGDPHRLRRGDGRHPPARAVEEGARRRHLRDGDRPLPGARASTDAGVRLRADLDPGRVAGRDEARSRPVRTRGCRACPGCGGEVSPVGPARRAAGDADPGCPRRRPAGGPARGAGADAMRALGVLAFVTVSAGACGPAQPPPVIAPPPVAETPKTFIPPAGTRGRLRNGIPVLVVHQASPFVAIRIVAMGGVPDVGADRAEVVSTMMLAFHAGSTTRNIYDIRETYVTLGMQEPETTWYADAATISFVAPVTKMRTVVELAADFTLHPSLDKMNFERWREQEANRDEDQGNDAALTADRVLRRVLFGSHAYGAGVLSAAKTRAVKRPDIVALHGRAFDPSRLS